MRVLMLSDHEGEGGAAIAASRLAGALVAHGHDVWRVVLAADGEASRPWRTWPVAKPPPGFVPLVRRVPTLAGRHLLHRPIALRALRSALGELEPDIVNIHNLHGGWDAGWSVRHVAECARRVPTVWTLHDMWSFTGRCAYSGACRSFVHGCDAACATPRDYPALSPVLIAPAWRERRSVLREARHLVGVSPSRWLAEKASEGLWRERAVEVIPYGLPLGAFRPADRRAARQALGLETTGPVLLATAARFDDPRKGASQLLAALHEVGHRPLTLLLMGTASKLEVAPGVHVVHLGRVESPVLQSLAYSAADVHVHAALADNLPNTVIEALACGTPTLSFDVGGLADLVRPGRTGWLVDEVSAAALGRGIDTALSDVAEDDLRLSCRAVAEAEYGDQLQAERYTDLFERLQASRGA